MTERRDKSATHTRLGGLVAIDWLLVLIVCLIPIGFMLTRSFGRANPVTLDVEITGTIDAYRTLLSDAYRPVLARSVVLSIATVTLCVVIGVPAALSLSRLDDRWRNLILVAVLLPSFVSFTVRMFAWQGVLATGGPLESVTGLRLLFKPPAVLVGMITAYVPIFVLPTYVALSRVPGELNAAAADLGAPPWRQLRTITLPLAMPGIVTGAVLVGVLAIGEFIVPAVLGGNKVLLLGNILAERGAGSDQPLGGAITAFMLTVFAIVALIGLGYRRFEARRRA
jgi:ABC-type spermidine/putrescine transport system permease subunit I